MKYKILFTLLIVSFLLSGCSNSPEAKQCKQGGGKWKQLSCINGDSCSLARGGVCLQQPAKGCDCGPDKCWNNTTCEPN